MSSPHDALFKHVFAAPSHAAARLRALLPAALAAELDWSTLHLLAPSVVDNRLSEIHCDLVFAVRIRGSTSEVVFGWEHRSQRKRLERWTMFRYVVRLQEQLRDPSTERVPLVIAVVTSHGHRPARGASDLAAAIARGPLRGAAWRAARRLLPSLRRIDDDLVSRTEEQLREQTSDPVATLAVLCLRTLPKAPEPLVALSRWRDLLFAVQDLEPDGASLSPFLRYTLLTTHVPAEGLAQLMQDLLGDRAMKTTLSTGERLIQEGFSRGKLEGKLEGKAEGKLEGKAEGKAEGKLEGKAEGAIEGRRSSLLEALHYRFGPVSADVEQRIAEATEADLRTWLARIFTAATLDQLFGE